MFPNNTTVIVRADLNIPLLENKAANLFRFTSFLPTFNALLKKNNKIIIITHLGKPNAFSLAPSTRILVPIFSSYGYKVQFVQAIKEAHKKSTLDIVLLENIRFMPQEITNDLFFGQQLKKLGTFFVQDAFASLHGHDCSIITLSTLFNTSEKSLGLLVQKEIKQLDAFSLFDNTKTVYFLAGGKIKKIEYVYKFLNQNKTVLLGPALCIPFLCLQYHQKNCCIKNNDILSLCIEIQKHALFTSHIILPVDLFIERDNQHIIISADTVRATDKIISIGDRTVHIFKDKIEKADVTIINGYMGFIQYTYCIETMSILLQAAFQKKHCLIGGADTIFFVDTFMKTPSSIIRSTGGGAMLAYLAYDTLAGLQSFIKKADRETRNL
ncbi:MAG TPA: phosphoglycerate kinase, partial [Patescibacteria group bacterium]|nr:phosphoglycerate kinase [Patescibacteria group bacterium]